MRDFFTELSRRAMCAGGRPALVAQSRSFTYAQLLSRIYAGATWATCLPERVGLLFADSADYALADLALTFAGKELVPLPAFFSDGQLDYIVRAAGLSHVVADAVCAQRAGKLGLATSELGAAAASVAEPAFDSRRIIFTSGTTGEPKGVRHSARQMLASVRALAEATDATAHDRYLSLLPNALLLEQIAGLYLPLLVGAAIHLPAISFGHTHGVSVAAAAEAVEPTVTILVPELLQSWTNELEALDRVAPASLRFVAVGGAPVPTTLIAAARGRGLPVYQGYGLTECCSVVSVNRPADDGSGTAGRPIPGVDVAISDGEIIVSGPTVMSGYLNGPDLAGHWATGDLGKFNPEGRLIVKGRKDNIIITSAGRNVSPEWIEQLIAADKHVRRCVVVEKDGGLVAVVVPADKSIATYPGQMRDILALASRAAPDYAKPRKYLLLPETDFHQLGLLTPNGRPRRSEIRALVKERSEMLSRALS
jgi:long-subunit acyl-CoA synthetase (AMP-forming)